MQDSLVQVDSAMLVEMRITKSSWILTRGDVCRRSYHEDCHQTCSSSDEVCPQVRCADEDVDHWIHCVHDDTDHPKRYLGDVVDHPSCHGRDDVGPWTRCAVEDVGPRSQRTWHSSHWTQMMSPVDQCANQLGK